MAATTSPAASSAGRALGATGFTAAIVSWGQTGTGEEEVRRRKAAKSEWQWVSGLAGLAGLAGRDGNQAKRGAGAR